MKKLLMIALLTAGTAGAYATGLSDKYELPPLTVPEMDLRLAPLPSPLMSLTDFEARPLEEVSSPTETTSVLLSPSFPDVSFFKSKTNPTTRPYTFLEDQTWVGIPLFVAGIIAKGEKTAFRQNYENANTKIRLIKYNFHSEWDNYTQFFGPVMATGLKLAGVEGRSDWPRYFASTAMSYGIMAAFVNGIKYTASEMRPDGSTRNSWPSGHTATAFVGATILHKEYGLTRSPWYSVAGYGVATATGVMRVLNNRHWISDVLSGAGIGILSGELAYGLSDLLFKGKGLLRNDLQTHPDLRKNASFFNVSMGFGVGNKNLDLPGFDYGYYTDIDDNGNEVTEHSFSDPLHLEFRTATAVGAEGAWFFCPYVGIGGRLRVKSTPINGWSAFAMSEQAELQTYMKDPDFQNAIEHLEVTIQSDHITEFAADLGVYFNIPLSERFAIGTKALVGRSIMDDIDVDASFRGRELQMDFFSDDPFKVTDKEVACDWDYINVHASNSLKFGTGISLTYAHKNNFSWRVFCDYDYAKKTYTAEYTPMGFFQTLCPGGADLLKSMADLEPQKYSGFDIMRTYESSVKKTLHQFVIGGAFCISF